MNRIGVDGAGARRVVHPEVGGEPVRHCARGGCDGDRLARCQRRPKLQCQAQQCQGVGPEGGPPHVERIQNGLFLSREFPAADLRRREGHGAGDNGPGRVGGEGVLTRVLARGVRDPGHRPRALDRCLAQGNGIDANEMAAADRWLRVASHVQDTARGLDERREHARPAYSELPTVVHHVRGDDARPPTVAPEGTGRDGQWSCLAIAIGVETHEVVVAGVDGIGELHSDLQ